jgi:hypothetical protein
MPVGEEVEVVALLEELEEDGRERPVCFRRPEFECRMGELIDHNSVLAAERAERSKERTKIATQRAKWSTERAPLTTERAKLVMKRDNLRRERTKLKTEQT